MCNYEVKHILLFEVVCRVVSTFASARITLLADFPNMFDFNAQIQKVVCRRAISERDEEV